MRAHQLQTKYHSKRYKSSVGVFDTVLYVAKRNALFRLLGCKRMFSFSDIQNKSLSDIQNKSLSHYDTFIVNRRKTSVFIKYSDTDNSLKFILLKISSNHSANRIYRFAKHSKVNQNAGKTAITKLETNGLSNVNFILKCILKVPN